MKLLDYFKSLPRDQNGQPYFAIMGFDGESLVPIRVNEEGKLEVGAEIEIETIDIGAVELKDGETNTKANVKSDGVNNALVVVQNTQPLPEGASTEATLSEINDKVATETTLNSIKTNTSKLDVNLSTRSTEATLSDLRDKVAKEETLSEINDKVATETTLQSIKADTERLDVGLSSRASETTLSDINEKVATETTLNYIKVNTNKLDVNLSSRASEETLSALSDKVATETTLSDVKTNTSKLDVNLSTRASEETLSDINDKVATDVELQKKPNVVTDFYIGSVAVPNKDTDITITLSGTIRRFMFKLRDPARRFRVYKQSGGAYITIPSGSTLYEENVVLTNPQFIFQTFDDNQTIEYMYWT